MMISHFASKPKVQTKNAGQKLQVAEKKKNGWKCFATWQKKKIDI